jgi:hypothetical protein
VRTPTARRAAERAPVTLPSEVGRRTSRQASPLTVALAKRCAILISRAAKEVGEEKGGDTDECSAGRRARGRRSRRDSLLGSGTGGRRCCCCRWRWPALALAAAAVLPPLQTTLQQQPVSTLALRSGPLVTTWLLCLQRDARVCWRRRSGW